MKPTTDSFNSIYDNYSAALYGTIIRKTDTDEMANLIFEKSFSTIFRTFHLYSPQQSTLFTWMMNIVHKEIAATKASALLHICQ